jgi:hypothetical protein
VNRACTRKQVDSSDQLLINAQWALRDNGSFDCSDDACGAAHSADDSAFSRSEWIFDEYRLPGENADTLSAVAKQNRPASVTPWQNVSVTAIGHAAFGTDDAGFCTLNDSQCWAQRDQQWLLFDKFKSEAPPHWFHDL